LEIYFSILMESLVNAFYNLAKINKIDLSHKANFDPNDSRDIESIKYVSKNLTLKDMIRLSATNKKMREIMTPLIEDKKRELEELRVWLSNLPRPRNYSTIEQLDQTERLYLYNNQLTSIPIINLPNLRDLNLWENNLINFPNLSFLPNLQILNLSSNRLENIPKLNLPNLQQLFLDNNRLTEFPKLNLPELHYLTLYNNRLSERSKDPKLTLPKLKNLLLANNNLQRFPKLDLPNLENLNLSNTGITEISESDLINLPKLNALILRHNLITQNSKRFLKTLNMLVII